MNIAATTTIDQYNINLRLEHADGLRTTYASAPGLASRGHHQPARHWQHRLPTSGQCQCERLTRTRVLCRFRVSAVRSPAGYSDNLAGAFRNSALIQFSDRTSEGSQGARITVQQRAASKLVCYLLVRCDFDSAADNPGAISTEFALGGERRPRPRAASASTRACTRAFDWFRLLRDLTLSYKPKAALFRLGG